ncbi:MAG TPA: xanthine dehydrogenase family protein molybdopterin-binding subunit [Thermoanaerobaculia bacterium]
MAGIGSSPPRSDGAAKVRGGARFADDFVLPGMLHGATVRSPHAHARIRALGWRAGAAPAGAVVVTARDLPGPNGVLLHDDSWPILADGIARHVGEAVALVAAGSPRAARAAAAAIAVEYEPLAAVLTIESAAAQAPLATCGLDTGGVDAALAAAPLVFAGESRTGHQEHVYIECQAMTAWHEGDTLVVQGSMQCPYYVHRSLAHALALPAERVRVIASAVGGGFGGKEDYPSLLALHAALLSRATGRPVRLAYDRHEDLVATPKRHPSLVRHRTGVDRDGRLLAMEIDITLDGGAYMTLSSVVLSRAVLHAGGPYRCPAVRIRARTLRTNTVPNGAFRGFGAPQVEFAVERQMDRIARELGLDPLEIRLRNVVESGDALPTGQLLDDSTAARLCLERVAGATDFRARWRELEARRARAADGEPLRGVGLSLYFHGAGFTGNGERRMRSPVTVRLAADGRLEALTAMTDMGQGVDTVFRQIAAEAAGVAWDDVTLAPVDTARVPDSGPTAASRTTMVVGGTLARAAAELRERLDAWRAEHPAGDGESFRDAARRCLAAVGALEVTVRHEPPAGQTFDEATYRGAGYPTYGWGADVAEVEVDPDTLAVKPLRVTAVCEVGRVIHPTLCAGQVEGGTLQAVGWALVEEMKLADGRYLNDRMATYLIPTAVDAPAIDVELLERPWDGGPFGAKGVGELPMDGGAPAVAAAIENALGVSPDEIPATPERLFRLRQAAEVAR